MQQKRLTEVGVEFQKEVFACERDLGESFTLRLVAHCSATRDGDPFTQGGWRLFAAWWTEQAPSYTSKVAGLTQSAHYRDMEKLISS